MCPNSILNVRLNVLLFTQCNTKSRWARVIPFGIPPFLQRERDFLHSFNDQLDTRPCQQHDTNLTSINCFAPVRVEARFAIDL
jgi:hypothetical protein